MLVLYNDHFVQRKEAQIDIEDRAYQFGDGIYEVIRIYDRQPFHIKDHLDRLEKSAKKIRINLPYKMDHLKALLKELINQNDFTQGNLYVQVSRGVAPRNHTFPKKASPVVIAYIQPVSRPIQEQTEGIRAKTADDVRWLLCDIKSLNLLGAVLAKQDAYEHGCKEAILVRDGQVTEGSSTNIFIVKNGVLQTHPANHLILHGITRKITLQLAEQLQIPVNEETFDRNTLYNADEVFLTSTTMEICPIVQIDGQPVGDGKPGKITRRLQEAFTESISAVSN